MSEINSLIQITNGNSKPLTLFLLLIKTESFSVFFDSQALFKRQLNSFLILYSSKLAKSNPREFGPVNTMPISLALSVGFSFWILLMTPITKSD